MPSIRINGLARAVRHVREQLAAGLTDEQVDELRHWVAGVLARLDGVLSQRGAKIEALPLPSRRAAEQLRSFVADAKTPLGRHDRLQLPHVQKTWTYLLRRMAINRAEYDEESYRDLSQLAGEVEALVARVTALGPAACALRGWLRFFAVRSHYDQYRAAVHRAKPAITAALRRHTPGGTYAWISFQPVRELARLARGRSSLRVLFATPMICFDGGAFEEAARVAFGECGRDALTAVTRDPAYGAIQAELRRLGHEGLGGRGVAGKGRLSGNAGS